MIIPGVLVVNSTNGKLEISTGQTVIGGLSSGNVKDMLTGLAELQLAWAKQSELSTDEESPDDAGK